MLITKSELIELDACEDGLDRFLEQTGGTEDPVCVSTLVGGVNTYFDLLWLAGEKILTERIVRFTCDCALISIELLKPYTDKYDLIVEFIKNPESNPDRAADIIAYAAAASAASADSRAAAAAARAARAAARAVARAAAYADYAARAADACAAYAACAAWDAAASAAAASTAAGAAYITDTNASTKVDKLLIEMFNEH